MSNEFDDFDDLALGNALRRMSGATPDADAALGTFHKRVRVARIRRISVAASSSAAVVLIAGGAFALASRGSNSPVKPADRGGVLDTIVDTTVDPGLVSTPPSSSALPGGSGSGADSGTTSGDSGNDGSGNDDSSGAHGESGSSGNNHDSGSGGGSGSSGGGTVPGSTTTTTTDDHGGGSDDGGEDGSESSSGDSGGGSGSGGSSTTIALVTKRCSSVGGAFTANRSAGNSITNVSPAAGFYKSEQQIESNKITVVFRSGELEYHVVATWNGSSFVCSVEP